MSNLTSLNLRCNGLLTVPEDFGNLKRLLRLNLSENQLTTLPASFVNLRNTLRLLQLIRNPIADEGKNGNLGKRELRAYFGDRVMFKSVEKDREFKRISKETALRNVLKQPLHWNLEVLKSLLNSPVPACDYSEEKMLSVWKSKFAALTTEGNNNLMTSYIRKLYNPGMDYERWPMTSEFVELTKSLLQGIFTKFLSLEVKDGQTEADVNEIISSNINGICEGIQFCPDRQISELRFTYRLLSGDLRDEEISVEQHVKDFIASRKEDIFDHVFTSHGSRQNVHVLTIWKLKLSRDLGFDFNFDSKIGSIEQDPFHNEPGNALEAFFNAFTPNIVISMLTDGINANKRVMCKVMRHIYQSNLPDSAKRKMLVGEDFETINISAITRECSEYLLTEFNILQRRRENSGTIRNFFKK